jgi:hypothetical protein
MQRTVPHLIDRAAARRELALREARRSFPAFVEHVFGWKLAPFHRAWAQSFEGNRRVLLMAAMEHAKTSMLMAFVIWTLGRNPNARIAIVFATHTQSARLLGAIREHIQANANLHAVFPNLRPASGARTKWSDDEIIVERTLSSKDASVIAIGLFGPVLGARLDLVVMDDVVTFENALTATQRSKVSSWFRSTLVGRVVETGTILCVGTPWHPDDLLHELERSGEYAVRRDAALTPDGAPLWPEVWSRERLEQRRREVGEIEFSRTMMLKVLSDAASRFRPEWFEHAFRFAREQNLTLVDTYDGPHATYTGVDLGVGQERHHDESATIAAWPDKRRQLLNVEAGRWQAPELVARIRATQQRYKSKVRVESNAAQQYVSQFLAADGVRVESHTTTRDKHLGIEALAVEFEQGRWLIPEAPASRDLVREMLTYSRAGHTGDRLIAAWLAREAATASSLFAPLPMFRTNDILLLDGAGRPRVLQGEFPEGCWTDVFGPWPAGTK